jgi:glutamate racemase
VVSGNGAPIGVFDSGIGGLTVVRELERQLPHERIIYFGDTARVPYGPKSPTTVQRYSREISDWLVGEGVKAIVVACNTATAHALPMLREYLSVPVVGVVEPGARAAMRATRSRVVGVIGTAGTIASGAYERAIHAIDPAARVVAHACPLFVPLVEEGWLDREATRLIAQEYLEPLAVAGVDTIVLGCTHYPLLAPLLGEIARPGVRLIDSAAETAAETRRTLREHGLEAPAPGTAPAHRFVASDAPDHVLRVGQRFLGSAIDRVEQVTLG